MIHQQEGIITIMQHHRRQSGESQKMGTSYLWQNYRYLNYASVIKLPICFTLARLCTTVEDTHYCDGIFCVPWWISTTRWVIMLNVVDFVVFFLLNLYIFAMILYPLQYSKKYQHSMQKIPQKLCISTTTVVRIDSLTCVFICKIKHMLIMVTTDTNFILETSGFMKVEAEKEIISCSFTLYLALT